MKFLNKIFLSIFSNSNKHTTETFTFYIPAPPQRIVGYREKQFDRITHQFFKKGYKLIDTKIVSHQGQNQEGFWVMFIVYHSDKNYIPDFDFPDLLTKQESDSDIEYNHTKLDDLELDRTK